MKLFKDRNKGICPECGSEIENINKKFCGNCGWKISKFKAINAKTKKQNELRHIENEKKMKKHDENAERHKQEFKQSINDLKNTTENFNDTKEDFKELKKGAAELRENLGDEFRGLKEDLNENFKELKEDLNKDLKEEISKNNTEVEKKYCEECGAGIVDTAKFCPNCGKKINDDSSELGQTSNNSTTLPKNEIMRETIKSMGASGVSGIDKNELTEKLLYFYDNNIPVSERINILMETFDIDYEDAKLIEHVQFTKVSLVTDYLINKDNGATKFDIEGKNGMLKTDVPISDFVSNIGFMIKSNGVPIFKNYMKSSSQSEQKGLVNYSTVNYVDLYETTAVLHSRGSGFGKKGFGVYSGTSKLTQEWTEIGRGSLTLRGDKCIFVGGGQQRIFDRKKIIRIAYFSKESGIEISVSNREKSMRFLLPGRSIEDGERLAEAVLKGKKSVALTELTKDPRNSNKILNFISKKIK